MRVLFIYTDVSTAVGYTAGIGALSAALKREGHQTRLVHVSSELDYPLDVDRINKDIREYGPGLICFSVTTNQWFFARQIGKAIKEKFDIPILVGGHHATADPDNVIGESWIDMVCRGEGDNMLPEVVRRMETGTPLDGTRNLIHRKNGTIVREPFGALAGDMDSLPFEDRSIFDYNRLVNTRSGWAEVIVTRGCPYPCTYCFNQPFFDEYRKDLKENSGITLKKKEYVRRRSVGSTLEMLKDIKSTYPGIKAFTFVDDIMAQEGEWLDEFTERYASEIGLPYACTSHPLLFTRTVAEKLKQSGCKVVKMGVEAGNEAIRKKVLKRNISNDLLVNVFGTATELGLKPQSFNMIGIPGETIDNIMETVSLNALMKPYIVWVSTFIPYPGSELYRDCVASGMLDSAKWDVVDSYRGASVLKDEYLPPLEFKKARVMFRWYLNANLHNEGRAIYLKNIDDLYSRSRELWENGEVEKIFAERDAEIDQELRKKDISHYVSKKYINIFWGREYQYDLS
ncbi:MAG: B12-binding domain-containing radical SAM protein [Nitrospirota bacterium]|nr:B12-binding domain-containing radical SAM protein [Nitrospirota bacterium]